MSNLKLITTEKFGDLECNFYRNMNSDILLTRKQIGTALEYSSPQKAIDNIHAKHKNRLEEFSVTLKSRGTDGKQYNTTFYSQRGVMEICRWSRQKRANEFMDWAWNIIENYRNGELSVGNINMQPLIDSLATITTVVSSMQQDIQSLKETQISLQKQLPRKRILFTGLVDSLLEKYNLDSPPESETRRSTIFDD